MTQFNHRPDPDQLLAALHKQEAAAHRGRLKIFFGMAAGVGKTYAMLEAARQCQNSGVDVVIGYIETHGRAETEALLADMTVLPRRTLDYRGVTLEELDLDALLARRPALAVVDELAHTNAPGARHTKRYQDVLELLDAGIDVYTTVNIQHLESRVDTVRQITGITVRETVPDSFFDLAAEIEVIDLTPEELRQRLHEGKVYLGNERATLAAEHFFRLGNLTALREMALRLVAERVDHQLQDYMTLQRIPGPWKSGERLLVAITADPLVEQLVRWTRRMAHTLNAPWLAVHVETPRALRAAEQSRLTHALTLADQLGAETLTTWDTDVAQGLLRIARERNVTQIVVGKPPANRWLRWGAGSWVDRLLGASGDIDIYVVTGEAAVSAAAPRCQLRLSSPWTQYLGAAGAIVVTTLLNSALLPYIGYRAAALLFLGVLAGLVLLVGRGPVLLAAALSALIWDWWFIPPQFTFYISALEDNLMLGMYFVVALVVGTLTARLQAQSRAVQRREQRSAALYALTRQIAGARTLDEVATIAVAHIGRALAAEVTVLMQQADGTLGAPHPASDFVLDAKELGVAQWVFENRRHAGRFTNTLPSATAYYLPLRAPGGVVGVLGLRWQRTERPAPEQFTLLEAFAGQTALIIERTQLDAAAEQSQVLAASEQLYQTLLNSVSHELRTPLTTITGAASSLLDPAIGDNAPARAALSQEIHLAAHRLNRIVENLLDMTRLESGRLNLRREWCDVHDLVHAALARVAEDLAAHQVVVDLPERLPLLQVDSVLLEQALYNILHNAAAYTPPGSRVRLSARVEGAALLLIIADRGPGLPPEDLERVFEKFYRAPGAPVGGTGLGLSIARGLVQAHGGTLTAENRANGGARFTLRLPLGDRPTPPPELTR